MTEGFAEEIFGVKHKEKACGSPKEDRRDSKKEQQRFWGTKRKQRGVCGEYKQKS